MGFFNAHFKKFYIFKRAAGSAFKDSFFNGTHGKSTQDEVGFYLKLPFLL